MAIDLGTLQTQNNGSFVMNLEKGFVMDLEKAGKGLKNITFAASWDPVFAGKKVDIDISAFVYHNDTLQSLDDVVWYKHTAAQTLQHSGDNRDGEGEGDDEKISIKLDGLTSDVNRIRLVATIYDFKDRAQNFGSAKNAFLTLHNDDENGKEEMRINLTSDYSMFVGIAVGDLVKKENSWQFVSIAEGYADDLNVIVNKNISAK